MPGERRDIRPRKALVAVQRAAAPRRHGAYPYTHAQPRSSSGVARGSPRARARHTRAAPSYSYMVARGIVPEVPVRSSYILIAAVRGRGRGGLLNER